MKIEQAIDTHVEIDMLRKKKRKRSHMKLGKCKLHTNDAEAVFKDSLNGHEQYVESSAHKFHQIEEVLDLSGCLRGKEFFPS